MKNCFKILHYENVDILVKKSAHEQFNQRVVFKVEFVIARSLGHEITFSVLFDNQDSMERAFEKMNAENSLDFLGPTLRSIGLQKIGKPTDHV